MPSPPPPPSSFGPSFLWGVATSAYQVEGATTDDGRGPSIWDTFSARGGTIADGTTGARACEHYRRFREDVDLMRWLGVNAYRFSVSWPRVFPSGRGAVNQGGLDFYDRLVDALVEAGIAPVVTLYHWDLPQALEDQGGWRRRETSLAFAEYARVVAARLGDRVAAWNTVNEPWCAAMLGYESGVHAPGGTSKAEALAASHHLLLAHGEGVRALRAELDAPRVGIAHMYVDCMAASDSTEDMDATARLDGAFNRWFLDPLAGRGYPKDLLATFAREGLLDADGPRFVADGDLETIAEATSFLGVNYYTRAIVRSDQIPEEANAPRVHDEPPVDERTDMGWEVYPEGLTRALLRLHRDYAPRALVVTENGAAFAADVDATGRVFDTRRTDYLSAHIAAVADAREAGAPVEGYFAWSLLDNFEWAFGYEKRFGLVHVDFETQKRTPKDSAHWYRRFLRQGKDSA